jgi:hypothetical protein
MSITRYDGPNYGSLILIEYLPVQYIATFNRSSKSLITAAGLTLKAGAAWNKIYCSQDTMGHRQQEVKDDNGTSWQQTVVGFIPADQPAIEEELLTLTGQQQYIVRVTHPDGLVRIVGTLKDPVDLKLDTNTQTSVPGPSGTAISFAGITHDRALMYTA